MFQILVVEDDASLRKLMSAALKQHGYVTFLANDGLEALDVLEKTNIDLIISDIMMPNMDGYELTRQLRKADFNLPILMVTAKETFEDKQEGFSAGTDDYMVKPIDMPNDTPCGCAFKAFKNGVGTFSYCGKLRA